MRCGARVRPWGSLLCGAKYVLNGLCGSVVAGDFGLELSAACRSEPVEADFAIGLRGAPVGCDPAFEQHFLKGGIEEALFNGEYFAGENVYPLGDGVTVELAGLKHAEDEHGKRAGRHSLFRPNRHRHNDIMP